MGSNKRTPVADLEGGAKPAPPHLGQRTDAVTRGTPDV